MFEDLFLPLPTPNPSHSYNCVANHVSYSWASRKHRAKCDFQTWLSLCHCGRFFWVPFLISTWSFLRLDTFLYFPRTDSLSLIYLHHHFHFVRSNCGSESCSVVSDSVWPQGMQPSRLLCPWDSPSKNTGGGCHSLLHGISQTQRSNLSLLHCRQILHHALVVGHCKSFMDKD